MSYSAYQVGPIISIWFRLQDTHPRGVIEVNRCLSIKGAEDVLNKPHAFEISTKDDSMFFIADTDKVQEWLRFPGSCAGWPGHISVVCVADMGGQVATDCQGMVFGSGARARCRNQAPLL
jgi:hypothetical protein